MSSERKSRVEQHAYRIWEQEGRPHGRDKDHWHRAERDLVDRDDANPAPGTSSVEAKRRAPAPNDSKKPKSAGAKPAKAAKPRKTGA